MLVLSHRDKSVDASHTVPCFICLHRQWLMTNPWIWSQFWFLNAHFLFLFVDGYCLCPQHSTGRPCFVSPLIRSFNFYMLIHGRWKAVCTYRLTQNRRHTYRITLSVHFSSLVRHPLRLSTSLLLLCEWICPVLSLIMMIITVDP